jgi:hypothetical protein
MPDIEFPWGLPLMILVIQFRIKVARRATMPPFTYITRLIRDILFRVCPAMFFDMPRQSTELTKTFPHPPRLNGFANGLANWLTNWLANWLANFLLA